MRMRNRFLLTPIGAACDRSSMRTITLGIFLFLFWLGLSGHYTPFLLAIGLAVSALAVFAASRMRALDEESLPLGVFAGTLGYYPWLAMQIAKSAWSVARIVLSPRLPISPTITVLDASQKTTTGIATYANSITLTPGTVTIGVKRNRLTVYALTHNGALELETGEMDRRVRRFEGTA